MFFITILLLLKKRRIGGLRHTTLIPGHYSRTCTLGWAVGSDPIASRMGLCSRTMGGVDTLRLSGSFSRSIHYFREDPDPRFRTRTHQGGYRQLPAVKWGASFESADDGFSIRHHHAGRISAEPLVAPAQVVGYVLGARCATSRSGLLSRIPTRGLFPDAASHIRVSFGWAPAIKQDGFTGFRCTDSIRRVYMRV